MNVELALITKIIATGRYEDVISKGVTVDLIADEEHKEHFEAIASHMRQYKKAPDMETFVDDYFPDFEPEHTDEPLEYVIDRFTKVVRKREAQRLIEELAESVNDPKKVGQIELEFLESARTLAMIVPTESVARFSDAPDRAKQYEIDRENSDQVGIPFGFPTLDTLTGGIQPHEFVTIAAFSGVGKTSLLNAIAYNVYSGEEDRVGMYISLEMEAAAMMRRFDAMASSLSYNRLKNYDLPEDQLEKWVKSAERIKKRMKQRDILVLDKLRSCTPDKVFAETLKNKPDIVFLDYLSLMKSSQASRSSSMWQTMMEITQDLKSNARTLQIPLVAAAQTNRDGAKTGADLDNIGYGISIVQDSDILLGLHADEEMKKNKLMSIRVKKNREGALGELDCVWNHDEMMFREQNPTDVFGKPGVKDSKSAKDKSLKEKESGKYKKQNPREAHEEEAAPKRKRARPGARVDPTKRIRPGGAGKPNQAVPAAGGSKRSRPGS